MDSGGLFGQIQQGVANIGTGIQTGLDQVQNAIGIRVSAPPQVPPNSAPAPSPGVTATGAAVVPVVAYPDNSRLILWGVGLAAVVVVAVIVWRR